MNEPYLKANLVAELAKSVNISQRKTNTLLTQLAEIAYREAPDGFTVPGICRLDIVHRKERRARVPSTGQQLLIGAHDTLRVRPLRKAKNSVTPRPPGLVQEIPDEPVAPPAAATPGEAAASAPTYTPPPPAPTPPATQFSVQTNNPEGFISFRCASCEQEIEAPDDMAGTHSECPTCGNSIEVPYVSEPGTIWGRAVAKPSAPETAAATGAQPQAEPTPSESDFAMKSRTIRIELPDDL